MIGAGEVKKEAAFLKKSGAKNFCYSGAGILQPPWPKLTKVFLVSGAPSLFLQKKNRLLALGHETK
jgi:hypothetical protein